MKKLLTLALIIITLVTLVACDLEEDDPIVDPLQAQKDILYNESELAFNFFWETSNSNESSAGYGLARDRYPGNSTIASVASVGFALASIPAGVENGWITREEGETRAQKTLETMLTLDRVNGFYYHFLNLYTGERAWNSEVSIIDTGLMLSGAIVVAEYFGGTVKELMNTIYDDINWNWYTSTGSNMFYMAYSPESGFSGAWNHMAEQMVLYVLAAGSDTYPTDDSLYKTVKQNVRAAYVGTYTSSSTGEEVGPYYYTYDGSLFQHQYSHAFIDFRDIVDYQGTDWFTNATMATKANYLYTVDNSNLYNTYSEISWGLSASDGPNEYRAYGAQLAKSNSQNGTIAPYAAAASVNYLEYESLMAVENYYSMDELVGEYGLKDAYNLGPVNPLYNTTINSLTPWYDDDYIGIDKGITILMIENYRSELIWTYFMQNENVRQGLINLGFLNVE
ncbi:MAG: glucoamylase family protein [Acholeplasmataceae bacterium]